MAGIITYADELVREGKLKFRAEDVTKMMTKLPLLLLLAWECIKGGHEPWRCGIGKGRR